MSGIANLRMTALVLMAATASLSGASISASTMPDGPDIGAQVPPPPPAPAIRTTPPPPVAIATERGEPELPPPAAFLVRVIGAGKEIWAGDVAIENNQGAELRLTLQQADTLCAGRLEGRWSRRQTGLTFAMRNAGRRDGDPFAVSAEWTRPSADCNQPGTRTTGIETTATVAPGATRTIEADGGLRIELTRRK